jgi:cell shape-determining protein MreC
MEITTLAFALLILSNILLFTGSLIQRHALNKAQKFLDNLVGNVDTVVGAVDKCIDIVNKNAELLLETANKTDNLEDEVTRLKDIYKLTKEYFTELETLNEKRRVQMPLSKRVYQLNRKEE